MRMLERLDPFREEEAAPLNANREPVGVWHVSSHEVDASLLQSEQEASIAGQTVQLRQ
jgi:hypothetical protein